MKKQQEAELQRKEKLERQKQEERMQQLREEAEREEEERKREAASIKEREIQEELLKEKKEQIRYLHSVVSRLYYIFFLSDLSISQIIGLKIILTKTLPKKQKK